MKMQLSCVIILNLIIITIAHETYMPNSKHLDVSDKCYLKKTEEYIDFGASSTPVGVCNKFTCRDDFVIRVDHCSRFTQPANCKVIPEDLTKVFPECCIKLRCVEEDGSEVVRDVTFSS